MQTIYLDYNATTPIAPRVQEAMLPFLAEHFGNPSSTHALGRASHEAVEDARSRVAQMLGAQTDEVLFTSGGTESNNLALRGVMQAARQSHPNQRRGHLIVSTIEHPATIEPARYLESLGYGLTVVECNSQGVVEPAAVEAAIVDETVLVSIMHANNEIGSIQPIRQIADICHARGVLLHTDAAQSVGKIRTKVMELGVDLLSIAGHKIYAPKGVGALYISRKTPIEPVLRGAGQENGLRPGTENVALIVGLGHAASAAEAGLVASAERLAMLRDRLLERLQAAIPSGLSVNGQGVPRLPNTLSVNFPGAIGSDLLRAIPELCASTGAACHAGSTHLSATLAAISLEESVARGTIRLSVGWYTSEEEVDRAADWLISAWENQR